MHPVLERLGLSFDFGGHSMSSIQSISQAVYNAFKCIAKYVAAAWKIRNAYAHPSDVA